MDKFKLHLFITDTHKDIGCTTIERCCVAEEVEGALNDILEAAENYSDFVHSIAGLRKVLKSDTMTSRYR